MGVCTSSTPVNSNAPSGPGLGPSHISLHIMTIYTWYNSTAGLTCGGLCYARTTQSCVEAVTDQSLVITQRLVQDSQSSKGSLYSDENDTCTYAHTE